MLNLLLETTKTYAPWLETTIVVLRSAFIILMLLASITIVIICLATESNAETGSNVITGNTYESFYAQNKGSTREGRLKRLLIISSIVVGVCAILFFVTLHIYPTL